MVKIEISEDARSICLLGHGIRVKERAELEPGTFINPLEMKVEIDETWTVNNVIEHAGPGRRAHGHLPDRGRQKAGNCA